MNKLRVGGETIDPKKQYSGSRVIELLGISFSNGYNKGKMECDKLARVAHHDGYTIGYKNGYSEASTELAQLKRLLKRLCEIEEEE